MKTIFVSSTFKDMHYERDAIREITAPLLNAEARKYGDELDFCDLRWGINTGDLDTEEGSKKVLDVCLDEIDRCEPPMVVLLGYRYGWIPEADLIKSAAGRKQLELEDLKRSVTALEIEYGALCDSKKFENTLFYFREIKGDVPSDYLAEDDEHAEKIAALKNRIKDMTGRKIKEYTLTWNGSGFDGVDAFAEMLAEDIQTMLMPGWKEIEKLTPFQRERRTHATFIREKNTMFRARQGEAEKLIKDALSQPVTIIKGEVGSGKSTLFSYMVTELEKTEWKVLPFISGLTTNSNSAEDIIANTVYFIEEKLHHKHYINEKDPQTGKKKKHNSKGWNSRLHTISYSYAMTGAKLLIMVDAAEQLTQSEERDKLRFIPTSVSENIHFVMTCTTDFKTPGREYYTLRELNDEDKQDVISGILVRSGKELSKAVINKMLELKASDNPLYLSLLVQRLLMMNNNDFEDIRSKGDGIAAIEQYQLELIENKCPDNLGEMSAALLNEAGKRINEKLVSKSAQYLAVSKNGLRKKDLSALLNGEWTEIDFSHFVNYMSDCFLLRDDGRYDFTHKSIREGFRRQCEYLNSANTVNREILEYLKPFETNDPVRMCEIIHHSIEADDKNFFINYIIDCYANSNDSHEDSIKKRDYASLDTYAKCISDGGKWLINVLKEAKKSEAYEMLNNLSRFCNTDLIRTFSENQKDLKIRLSVITAAKNFSQHLYDKLKSDHSQTELIFSYYELARTYEKLGGRKNIECALQWHLKRLKITEQQTRIPIILYLDYKDVAECYMKLGDKESFEHARKLCNRCLAMLNQHAEKPDAEYSIKQLHNSYEEFAKIFEGFGSKEGHEHAVKLYNKSLAIHEQYVEKFATEDNINDLCHHYENVAKIFEGFSSKEDYERVVDLYTRSLALREHMNEKFVTAKSKRSLSISYNNIARIYEKLGSRDNLEQALELYRKDLAIFEQLDEELGTVESKKNLAVCYHKVACILEKFDGNDNLEQALELYRKALAIRESLAVALETVDAYDDLAVSLLNIAKHPSTAKSDQQALLTRGLEICKGLYEKTDLNKYNVYIDEFEQLLQD